MSYRIQNGGTDKIRVTFYNSSNAVITGLTIPLSINRKSDGKWYTGSAWQDAYITFNMTEEAGDKYHEYVFDTSSMPDNEYIYQAICSDAACVNPIVGGELRVGGYVDDIDAAISTRATPAQVNTEVLDVLNVDTYAEITSTPTAPITIRKMLQWMFQYFRHHKTVVKDTPTTGTETLFQEDGTTPMGEASVSDDDTTFDKGAMT